MEIDWARLKGGYRKPYDPRSAVRKLRQAPLNREVWNELWTELHHQGDLGDASYATVPLLVGAFATGPRDWNLYGLVATIEVERYRKSNPELPVWIAEAYFEALAKLKAMALEDLDTARDKLVLRTAMAIVALVSGDRETGALLAHLDACEVVELLDERLSWGALYRPATDS